MDRIRAYKVFVDGEFVGKLGNDSSAQFPVEPGEHEIQLRIDWARSRCIRVRATPETPTRLLCSGRPTWQALYWATFGLRNYIRFEPA